MEQSLHVQASLRLVAQEKVFGPGIARLLEGVDRLGSLRRSAAEMEMSYSKAWSILRSSEAQLGFPLLERKTGGPHGGGAVVTPQGKEFLLRYRAFEREAQETLNTLLIRHFQPYLREGQCSASSEK